ncbi:LCP family protein [Luteimicrobium sp. DT211]|uniref:LCP family protein n=1 Tax=Luteimicrobium sp. DT211 TaxID=3393412 RepID=UPI003CFAC6FC
MTPDPRSLPPSFTPQSGRESRPEQADGVIKVGPDGGGGATPPPPPARPASRVTRQSSGPVPVDRSGGRARARTASGPPPTIPPGGVTRAPRAAGDERRPTTSPTTRAPSRPPGGGGAGRGPGDGARSGTAPGGTTPGRLHLRKGRIAAIVAGLVVVAMIAWPVGVVAWANGKLDHVDALSDAADTPGTTYLIAGSDSRADGVVKDGTSGARTDTIMVLQVPDSGTTSLISIPRDSYVKIPGHGSNKINAAYAYGGAPLLVKTVEKLTGMHVDHYAEVGFGGVEGLVDAVGGVHLCLDYDVDDKKSELKWKAGCHDVGGKTALAFSRMRYSDPTSDFGRTERQRQLVDAISQKAAKPSLLFKPATQVKLIDAGTGVLEVDKGTNIVDLAKLAMAFKSANGKDGVTGLPPISDRDYRPGGVGSSVRLDPDKAPKFFANVMNGKLKAGTVNSDSKS